LQVGEPIPYARCLFALTRRQNVMPSALPAAPARFVPDVFT
jgi:hypothetical protein